LVGAFCV